MEGGKILLVDDRPEQMAALRDGLIAHNCDVRIAHTIADARAFDAHDFDLIVLDREIRTTAGVEDGLELCREMRAAGVAARIVFFTNLVSSIEHREGWVAGADDYIEKTWPSGTVLARCLAHLERARPRAEASSAVVRYAHPELGPERALVVDEESLFVARQEDFDFMRQGMIKKRQLSDEARKRFAALKITTMDQALFFHLYNKPDQWVSEAELMRHVWGHSEMLIQSMLSNPDANGGQVPTGVSRIRRKLDTRIGADGAKAFGGRSQWAFIETGATVDQGVSYRFARRQLEVSQLAAAPKD